MFLVGTFETCRLTLGMSANRGRPEVSGVRSSDAIDPRRSSATTPASRAYILASYSVPRQNRWSLQQLDRPRNRNVVSKLLRRRKCSTGKTGQRFLLRPIAHHRYYGRAVWIDPVVLRAITISWNNIGIPVRSWPYYWHPDDKPHPWFTNDFGLPRMGCGTKRPHVTQHQGRSESERGHYPHTSASLPQSQINERLVMIVPAARGGPS